MNDDFLVQLIAMNGEAKEAHTRYLGLKEDAADAKKSWEARVTAIQEAIDGFGKDYPLFDHKPGGGPEGGGGWGGGGDDGPGPASPPPDGDGDVIDVELVDGQYQLPAPERPHEFYQAVPETLRDESWRAVSLDALSDHGLSDKLVGRMAESGLKTIGDLANWSNGGKLLTDLEGVGAARADEIEAAMDSFWAAWRRPKSGGDLVTSRPGTWTDAPAEEPAKKPRKKRTAFAAH